VCELYLPAQHEERRGPGTETQGVREKQRKRGCREGLRRSGQEKEGYQESVNEGGRDQ
jgi:hypothetical protein